MPEPLIRLHAIGLPQLRDNIDTDELIPVWENTRMSTTGFGDALFAGQRYLDGAGHTPDPAFILNQAPYDRAGILVSGSNFGCGSSRETAVWALRDYGIRVIVAVSFNETFKRNCIVNGLAPLAIARSDAERLVAAITGDPERGITADLERGLVWQGDAEAPKSETLPVSLDPFYCSLLTTGRTEDNVLAELQPAIDARRDDLVRSAPWLSSGDRAPLN